jgi:hypothetical protein
MSEKAVVDRIVDGTHAVLLVGEDEEERIIPASDLPEGAKPGIWLQVRFSGDELVEASLDEEETQSVQGRIAAKLAQLRQRGRRR